MARVPPSLAELLRRADRLHEDAARAGESAEARAARIEAGRAELEVGLEVARAEALALRAAEVRLHGPGHARKIPEPPETRARRAAIAKVAFLSEQLNLTRQELGRGSLEGDARELAVNAALESVLRELGMQALQARAGDPVLLARAERAEAVVRRDDQEIADHFAALEAFDSRAYARGALTLGASAFAALTLVTAFGACLVGY